MSQPSAISSLQMWEPLAPKSEHNACLPSSRGPPSPHPTHRDCWAAGGWWVKIAAIHHTRPLMVNKELRMRKSRQDSAPGSWGAYEKTELGEPTDLPESEWTPRVGDGQGRLACCDSWGRKESDTTDQLDWTELNWTDLHLPLLSKRRRQWHPTPALLPGKSHGRRNLEGCSPWVAERQTQLSDFTFTFHFHALEKEMATHSSVLGLENPREGGAWWAAVYGVTQSRTQLKWLSNSNYLVKD